MEISKRFKQIFLPQSGARAFFRSIIFWGIGVGCFASSLNNYLAEIYSIDGFERGWVEFFRELPGFLLVLFLAILHKVSDWKIMRIACLTSMIGAAALLLPLSTIMLTFVIMVWSLGEHLIMPVRSAITMQVAKPERAGLALGFLNSAMCLGVVIGSLIVAGLFYVAAEFFDMNDSVQIYRILWCLIIILLALSLYSTFSKNAPSVASKKPRLHFKAKFLKFYVLELFYGARKQIFLTFAPYLLIINYKFSTSAIAALLAVCALINIFCSPMIGKLTDRLGYKNIMIYDTVILFFVCLLYGFAGDLFSETTAIIVLSINFVLDAVISTTSLATNIYVRQISASREELTSSITSGISVNHLISILCAPLGGWIWIRFGVEYLFGFAAIMALLNSAFALTLPKPVKHG